MDAEWQSIAPHLPAAKRLGRPRETDLREAVNAMQYVLTTGCQWRLLSSDFPPYTTVQRFFRGWRDDGTWRRINHHLLLAAREAAGREASPSAGVIDSQSVKTTEAGGPRGYDAGKKIPTGPPLLASVRSLFPGCATSSTTAAMPARSWKPPWPRRAAGPWRSSNGRTSPRASSCCRGISAISAG